MGAFHELPYESIIWELYGIVVKGVLTMSHVSTPLAARLGPPCLDGREFASASQPRFDFGLTLPFVAASWLDQRYFGAPTSEI